ncbi:hypothetical protein SRB17_07090 [Streptomyces sp. RB17]|nr:hypothetical protein [Streptomyces sp. RB17]
MGSGPAAPDAQPGLTTNRPLSRPWAIISRPSAPPPRPSAITAPAAAVTVTPNAGHALTPNSGHALTPNPGHNLALNSGFVTPACSPHSQIPCGVPQLTRSSFTLAGSRHDAFPPPTVNAPATHGT